MVSARIKVEASANKARDMVKIVVHVQLGVYGMVYDEVAARIISTRKEAPKQWGVLVKRGEKVQQAFEKSGREFAGRIQTSHKKSLGRVKAFGKKAA